MNNNNSALHKAGLDRVSSPAQLDDYIQISRPSVWLILWTVVVLLVGSLIWSVFGTLTTNLDAVAMVSEGTATCYLPSKKAADLAVGLSVRIANSTGVVRSLSMTPMEITDAFDPYALYLGEFQKGDFVVSALVDINMPDGAYPATIILESIAPISFILN